MAFTSFALCPANTPTTSGRPPSSAPSMAAFQAANQFAPRSGPSMRTAPASPRAARAMSRPPAGDTRRRDPAKIMPMKSAPAAVAARAVAASRTPQILTRVMAFRPADPRSWPPDRARA